ncbi:radical SAM protein [Hornefia butyriciproducens]|uniref:radical SAM protein n=2 Tax=Hornefia butyriciproducens TaxID=2652293 RepID=UPI002A90D6F9|nr:radical SAM protein [Hornefia butyriciproducens]MCI7412860.1 radical SAM protein [Clostridiales bacterium]MDY6211770.1 radical SAM protein [Hornefia butyriciproducens]
MNLDLHLTTACNMKCSFCGAWEYGRQQEYITLEDARAALKAGRQAGYKITTLTGGEPSVHRNYTDIIQYAHSLGYWTVVTTNGLHLTDEMLAVYRKCRTLVRVSLHTLCPRKHAEMTGGDTLHTVMRNIEKLRENKVNLGLGCTVFDKNLEETDALAEYACKSGASFIRYTPVVGIRGAESMNLEYDFFKKLLTEISRLCLKNYDLMERKTYGREYAHSITRYMLTRRCAGGSGQHIIYDCHGTVVPCSFIPESAGLCSPASDGSAADRFRRVYQNMDELLGVQQLENMKGRCGKCRYKTSCRGGCMTTKLPAGLAAADEQPVCMYSLISEICGGYDAEDRYKLENYWCSNFIKKTGASDRDKVCVRRLPVWELNFRFGADRMEFVR